VLLSAVLGCVVLYTQQVCFLLSAFANLHTGRSDPGRRTAEVGLANGDNLRNSFPLVTGNSPIQIF
jgi:hypothetical protein